MLSFSLDSLSPPQLSSSCLKAKWVPCRRGSGGGRTCAVRTRTRPRGWEDECVWSNPTSPQHTHTLYTNPRTLIKGILGHNRGGGADCNNEQRNMAWRYVCIVCLWMCDCIHASMSKCLILLRLHACVCSPIEKMCEAASHIVCLCFRPGTHVSMLHAHIPLFICSRVCTERPGFKVLV